MRQHRLLSLVSVVCILMFKHNRIENNGLRSLMNEDNRLRSLMNEDNRLRSLMNEDNRLRNVRNAAKQ